MPLGSAYKAGLARHETGKHGLFFLKPEHKRRGNREKTAKVCAHVNHELKRLGYFNVSSDVRAPGSFGALREAEPYPSHNRDVRIPGYLISGIPIGFTNPEIQTRCTNFFSPSETDRAQDRFQIRAEFVS